MLLALATGAAARPTVLRVPILMFHRVAVNAAAEPAITRALTVAPRVFATEMEWLKGAGFHAVSLSELYAALEHGASLPPKPIAITFDDGYRDVLWNAAPVLHRLHMPATEFVITGRVDDGDPSYLSWPELVRLERLGFAIGSHTVHHLELTLLPPEQARYELDASRGALRRHLHRAVWWFAYPAGRVDGAVASLVRAAGYRLAFTTQSGDLQQSQTPLLLHRDAVYSWTGLRGIEAFVR